MNDQICSRAAHIPQGFHRTANRIGGLFGFTAFDVDVEIGGEALHATASLHVFRRAGRDEAFMIHATEEHVRVEIYPMSGFVVQIDRYCCARGQRQHQRHGCEKQRERSFHVIDNVLSRGTFPSVPRASGFRGSPASEGSGTDRRAAIATAAALQRPEP